MCCCSQPIGAETAMAMKPAITIHVIGLRSTQIRYSDSALTTTIVTTRRMLRMDGPSGCGIRAAKHPRRSGRIEQRGRNPGDAEQPGPGMGTDHRAYLRHEDGLAAEDLAPRGDQVLGALGILDVLDGELVAAVVAPLAQVLLQALD